MKLERILDQLNSFEKNSFLKVITTIIDSSPKNFKEIEEILSETNKDLKNVDNINIAKVFSLVEDEFLESIKSELTEAISQLDILVDIIIRDGNCIMSRDWFNSLYENEIKSLSSKTKAFEIILESDKSEIEEARKRDYKIYKSCLYTAYYNDIERNQECKITCDEQSILLTLARGLGLSQEEIKLINYLILGIKKLNIDKIINELKNLGIVFYTKKNYLVYIPDEVIRILRKIRGKEIADKYFRRVLRQLREPQINLVARRHNIDWKLPLELKIKKIIKEGIHFSEVLLNDIFKDNVKTSERKTFINQLIEKDLNIFPPLRGATNEEKVHNLVHYFEQIDKEDKVGISIDGYEKMLNELEQNVPEIKDLLKTEFELQDEDILKSNYLLDYNIKPRDILDLLTDENLKKYCEIISIKTRGDLVTNILDNYKDTENLYIENYINLAYRDLNVLKDNGIIIKESDIGIKFEEITKTIFSKLGFSVDEKLRKSLNDSKHQIDIILNLGNNELILLECKTVKESGYNKFSSVYRQIKSYIDLVQSKNYRVLKSLLIAPEFSDEFEKDCREEYELNLSLITASSIINILEGFKESKLNQLPYQLLLKDVLIKEDWVLKAISK